MSEPRTRLGRAMFFVSMIAAVYIVLFHIAAFALESFVLEANSDFATKLLGSPVTGVAATFAVNQGVYNLAIAIVMAVAVGLSVASSARRESAALLRLAVHLFVTIVGIAGAVTVTGLLALAQMAPGLIGLICTAVELTSLSRARVEKL